MNAEFSRIITLIRKEKKISQKQAAAELGISQALLSHYEKGIRECGLDFLARAADYYEVSCDILLGRSPMPQNLSSVSEETDNTYQMKKLFNSQNTLMKICEKYEVSENAYNYLSASAYKLLRIVCNCEPEFKISDFEAENLSDCLILKECAEMKKKCSQTPIRQDISKLSQKSTESHLILSLIKSTENKIDSIFNR